MTWIDTLASSPCPHRARVVKNSLHAAMAALIAAALLPAPAVEAKNGASISVTSSASVSGTTVSGAATVANAGSQSVNVSAALAQLEVRFRSGTTPPALPAGSSSGWYVAATQSLPLTGTVAANGSRSASFAIDTCAAGVASDAGAKDMRAAAIVTAGQSYSGASLNFALPGKCPVCGNGILEAGEQPARAHPSRTAPSASMATPARRAITASSVPVSPAIRATATIT